MRLHCHNQGRIQHIGLEGALAGGLGDESPTAGSRGRAPVRGSLGAKAPEARRMLRHEAERTTYGENKKLSCRREAARCFVFVCGQLQHTYSAVFLLLVTAASDLQVHKILLNSFLLFPIVSSGVRPKLPGQTPLGHNPPFCCHSQVGWGQDPDSWVG